MNKFAKGDKVRLVERCSIRDFFDEDEVFTVEGFMYDGKVACLSSQSGPRVEVGHLEIVPA